MVVLQTRTRAMLAWSLGLVLVACCVAGLLAAVPVTRPPAPSATSAPPPSECPPPIVLTGALPERWVCSAVDLDAVLRSDFIGRVIVPRDVNWEMITPCGAFDELGRCIDVPMRDIPVQSGVRLIGERGALGSRPLLFTNDKLNDGLQHSLFRVEANNVRIEGLHLRGPEAGDRDEGQPDRAAITVIEHPDEDPEKQRGRNIIIADNELDEWPTAGVRAEGTVGFEEPPANYKGPRMGREDVGLVRVERNYIHNNAGGGFGYGVVVGNSAYLTIKGNVFNYNRHGVSADGRAFQGYTARFNYLLEGGFRYGNGYYGQHFDVHGTADEHNGGPAGEFYQIAFNTIRGEQNYGAYPFWRKTRPAFELRGRPAIAAEFDNNVVVHDYGEAIRLKAGNDDSLDTDRPSTFHLRTSGTRHDTDYTGEIAAGDFDGDRRTDVFVATGTAWFFSRAGVRPWELLHESTKRTGDLALADIDNDAVTDVLSRDPSGGLGYLKSGREALVPLTSVPVPINELRFGDFDGDDKTDIFFTHDQQWHVWYGRDRQWRERGARVSRSRRCCLASSTTCQVPTSRRFSRPVGRTRAGRRVRGQGSTAS